MRITNSIRKKIIEEATAHAREKHKPDVSFEDQVSALCVEAYDLYYAPHKEYMNKLPEDFFLRDDSFEVYFVENGSKRFAIEGRLPTIRPMKHGRWHVTHYMEAAGPLYEKALAYRTARKAFAELIEQTQQEVRSIVGACNTAKQLRDAWPEGVEIFEDIIPPEGSKQALVVRTETANKLLKLPSEQQVSQ